MSMHRQSDAVWGVCRWTPGAGGGKANNCYTKLCEARGDLYPMVFFAVVITGNTMQHTMHPIPLQSSVMLHTWLLVYM